MKKYLYILAVLSLASCKPTPDQIAKHFILDRAIDRSSFRILSHSEVLRPELTKVDTFYHIASFCEGVAYSDSIRIETHQYPEHYYCYLVVEGNDSTAKHCKRDAEIAVFPDGNAMFYNKYREIYYSAHATETRAQRDTLTDMRTPSFYKDAGVWALKQMLMVTNR